MTTGSFFYKYPGALEVARNATGHIIHIDGEQAHMIEALSQMLNFRWVHKNTNKTNKNGKRWLLARLYPWYFDSFST